MITILSETPGASSASRGPRVGIQDIIKIGYPSAVSERLDRALKNIHRLSENPGAWVRLKQNNDYPVFFAEDPSAFSWVKDSLIEEGWIKLGSGDRSQITLTVKGWNRIAELERDKLRKDSIQTFVAMSFHSSLVSTWEKGFEEAISEAGYNPVRMDVKEHNEKICDAIIAEIRKSKFVVADFTGHRGGVYFEAGYALGLGLPVIWTCREDDLEGAHFDTRQYNHIVWESDEDLYEKLRRRIEATIAR